MLRRGHGQPVIVGADLRHYEQEKLGTVVAAWEDGLRTDMSPGTFEWWYFDVHADDGTLIVIIFFTKPMVKINSPPAPFVNVRILTPDGVTHRVEATTDLHTFVAAQDHCAVNMGPNRVQGDLTGYRLQINIQSIRCNLTFIPSAPAWRPGVGKILFGPDEDRFFGWLVPMPNGQVIGELQIGSSPQIINGVGYHDHNWGTMPMEKAWNNWWWSRSRIGDFTVLAAELTATPVYGNRTIDFMMVADGKQLLVEDTSKTRLIRSDHQWDPDSRRTLARSLCFSCQQEDASVILELNQGREIFRHCFLRKYPAWKQALARLRGIDPWYFRYRGVASLTLTRSDHSFSGTGDVMYEQMYIGPDRGEF